MIRTLAVSGYRSLREVVVPLDRLTLVTGANGSGKTSLYRALRLLADVGHGRVASSLAREGGLSSALWAGPASLLGARRGHEVQGTVRSGPISLRLGMATDDLGYLVDLGLPVQSGSAFDRDPEVKRELVWQGPVMRPATTTSRRRHERVETRDEAGHWGVVPTRLTTHRSMLTELADPVGLPDLWAVRRTLRSWRFYDGFRADVSAPARRPQVGTRTPSLAEDGADLAAALQTIREDGPGPLDEIVADAFDGARVQVQVTDGLFELCLLQPGMLRPLAAAELSDGTLRFLLWTAALLTPQPPALLVVNEPETSLHPSLYPALARLVREATARTQVVVVSHSAAFLDLVSPGAGDLDRPDDLDLADGLGPPDAPTGPGWPGGGAAPEWALLAEAGDGARAADGSASPPLSVRHVVLEKDLGETRVRGQGLLSAPAWEWGRR